MRTTLDFQKPLLMAAKRRAASEGKTMTALIEEALRSYLGASRRRTKPFVLEPLVKAGAPMVDVADRNALYGWLEEP